MSASSVSSQAAVPSPAERLAGRTLSGGWKVLELLSSSPNSTGGRFSKGYLVESKDGVKAFLKALDYSEALRGPDPARALQALTTAYNFERDILEHCKDRRLTRIVTAITNGKIEVDDLAGLGLVEYLIFELAEGDARTRMDAVARFDVAWRLRALHNIATGLRQLHGEGIAHQDLKPSNVLVFHNKSSKLADLGRSVVKNKPSPFEGLEIAGDLSYAPPELLYHHISSDWSRRRLGCDAYLLGSMVVFFFTGLSMTSLWMSELHPAHCPQSWSGSFGEIMPYLRDAFGRAVDRFKDHVVEGLRNSLVEVTRELCEPDPTHRGHPRDRSGIGNQYSLERYISRFELLAKKAEYGWFKEI